MRDDAPYTDEDAPPGDNVRPLRPPALHNVDAERALLGAILTEPTLASELQDHVDADDFYEPRHETIWQAIYTVVERDGLLPDFILVNDELRQAGHLTKIGGTYLPDLVTSCPSPTQATHYATLVRNAARLRSVDQAATRLHHLANTATPDTVDHALAESLQTLDDLATRNGPRTITAAVNYVAFNGLFSKPRTPIAWVIAPILAAGRVSLMYSPGKTGKSLIAIEAAAAIATGRTAMATHTSTGPQHVLYIDQEMTEDDWIDRLTDMGYNTADEANLAQYLHLAQLQNWPAMDTAAGGRAVEAEALRTRATAVIIDTASKVIAGEENANDTQQAFYRNTLIPLKRAGIAVLVLDHTGKDLERGARGASAKTDNIDLAFELLQRGRDLLTLRCTHARVRDDLLDEPTYLRRTVGPLAHVIEDQAAGSHSGPGVRPTFLMEKVSRYIEANPGASKTTIETAVKGKTEYVRVALELLVLEQYVETEKGPRNVQMHRQIKPYREDEDQ